MHFVGIGLLLTSNVFAQSVNKCVDKLGRVTFQDGLCDKSTEKASKVSVITNDFGTGGLQKPVTTADSDTQSGDLSSRATQDCDNALAQYKLAVAAKRIYVRSAHLSPEGVAVNAKCGPGSVGLPSKPRTQRAAILTKEVLEGLHKVCIYSDGSSESISGVGVCELTK